MEIFFQRFLPIAKAIKALIDEQKKTKISLMKNTLHFSVVTDWEEGEEEKSAMEFFLFIKKKIISLDIYELSMGEREALLEIVEILESYIVVILPNSSKVLTLLRNEIFAIKIGGMIPREYLSEEHEDLAFIKRNGLENILFYHGVVLNFHPFKGISFPIRGPMGILREVYFSDLKRYDLQFMHRYYYNGEHFFTTNADGLFLHVPKIIERALVSNTENAPFVHYQSGYPAPSLEVYHRGKDFFIALHDGEGAVYRYGVEEKRAISPDKYAYSSVDGFEKIIIPTSDVMIAGCLDILNKKSIESKEAMIHVLLDSLEVENDCMSFLTTSNKFLSYLYLPKLLWLAVRGLIPLNKLLKPWTIVEIDYEKLEKRGDELRKRLT